MVRYPIHVSRVAYRGNDPRKRAQNSRRNAIANQLEQHINALLREQVQPIANYMYHQIASDTGVPLDTVRELCFSIDGGHNGFTVIRQDLTFEEAQRLLHSGDPEG